MGAKVSREDYEWVYDEEPHATRRKLMLEKYPEIKQLMGHDATFKYIVLGMVIFQLISLYFVNSMSWFWVIFFAYCIGGTINHSLMLGFKTSHPFLNRIFGLFANLPIGVPFSATFRRYHLDHHRYLGDKILDLDIPCELEARLFCSTATKFLWLFLQPFFYALRPVFVRPLKPSWLEIMNTCIQISFDCAVVYFLALVYMVFGSLLSMGLHPVAGHFISEHYMFHKGFETYSYYGPLNWITFNVGYHNEHHDFPNIPGSRLPQVKKIAPEFYDCLPQCNSWIKVLYDFVMDPTIGPYARVRRNKSKEM